MSAKQFQIKAGASALAQIKADGFSPDMIGSMIGASGGPKWLSLAGLDQVLAGHFFKGREKPLYTLGSSAGAWRHVAYGVADNVAALKRFENAYLQQRYETQPTAAEVSAEGLAILREILGDNGIHEVVNNPVWRTNLLAVRSRGLLVHEHKVPLSVGLLATAVGNFVSRKGLRHFFERTVFSPQAGLDGGFAFSDFPTHQIALSEENLLPAVLASGSIPLVMEGVADIPGAPEGMYRDGGFIDYHFDFNFQAPEGLIFYPHFFPTLSAGWFDKFIPWRSVPAQNLDSVVMISPSADMVARLPNGKIPDRNDFKNFDNDTRISQWQQVVDASADMAEEFYECWQQDRLADLIQPF